MEHTTGEHRFSRWSKPIAGALALAAVAGITCGLSRSQLGPVTATAQVEVRDPVLVESAVRPRQSQQARPVTTTKRSQDRPTPQADPLEVPLALQAAPDVTVTTETNLGPGKKVGSKTIRRFGDHVLIFMGEDHDEWSFVRNPVDPRRVSATRIDRKHRRLVQYSDSELRMGGLARGWADAAGMGVKPEWVEPGRASGRTSEWSGVEFREYVSEDGQITVWWSPELAVPLSIEDRGAQTRVDLRKLVHCVANSDEMSNPTNRFATYAIVDVADEREALHEHQHEGGH